MTDVYRVYDEHGVLLYVGMTDDYTGRMLTHSRTEPWFLHALDAVLEEFPSRAEAAAAELRAIKAECPLWNVAGSPNPERARSLRREAARPLAPFDRESWFAEARERRERFEALVNTNFDYRDRRIWGDDDDTPSTVGAAAARKT